MKKIPTKRTQELIEEATVDAYDEDEQMAGFCNVIEDEVKTPFKAKIIGEEVEISAIRMGETNELLAVCKRDGKEYKVSLESLEFCHCGSGKKYKKCCLSKDEAKNDPTQIILHASQHPIEVCLIRKNWKDDGLASILIVRKNQENGQYLFCSLLIDTYCLGVKNAFAEANVAMDSIEKILFLQPYETEEVDYEHCRGLILGSIDFARKLGFEPHEDWGKVKPFVEADKPYSTKHVFGRDGKPFYLEGPDDDVEAILKTLAKTSNS